MKPERAAELLRESEPVAFDEARSQAVERRVLEQLRTSSVVATKSAAKRGRLVPLATAVALAAALLLVLRGAWQHSAPQLALTDGSRAVAVSPDARVVPELVAENRVELRQTAGSVEYDVTPRPERLFVVHVGSARVEVLGTAFRIDRSEHSVHVAVTRGRVRVVHDSSSAELAAGEEVTLATPQPPRPPQPPAQPPAAAGAVPVEQVPAAGAASSQPATSGQSAGLGATPSAAELFLRADEARSAGDTAGALRYLRELLRAHPKDGRASLARFTIGRLESARGNSAAAAEAFEGCGAALNGEALAEAALARAAAGQPERARALALRYRAQFPSGPRSAALEKLAQ